jgi:hypothetical protein
LMEKQGDGNEDREDGEQKSTRLFRLVHVAETTVHVV